MRLDDTFHPNQRLHLCVQPVAHKFELAVRRDEANCAVILEPGESNTLVELDILHLDGLASGRATSGLKHDLVVQTQPQLGHTTQVAFHFDGAQNLGPQDVSVC